MKQKAHGFTIVELLIVIVVIAILAAISIVAYRGITNRAYDSSVSADMSNLAKRFEMARVNSSNEAYPFGNDTIAAVASIKANKAAYKTGLTVNLLVCLPTASSAQQFLVIADSKSGSQFLVENGGSVKQNTGTVIDLASGAACSSARTGWVPAGAGYSGGDTTTGPWRAWAGGN